MPKYMLALRRIALCSAALLLLAAYPMQASAEDPAPASTSATTPSSTTPADGTNKPNGDGEKYYYDAATGHWNSNKWVWDPTSGQYVKVKKAPASNPPATATTGDTAAPANSSTSGIDTSNGSSGTLNSNTGVTVNNNANAGATTGDATVAHNTQAGDATTGNAVDAATILNLLQSTTGLQGSGFTTFNTTYDGNVQGDITLDPSQLPSSSSVGTSTNPSNVTINAKDSGQINNDVTLSATSGNAKVAGNTDGGNATTGSASTMADIVNVINSVIASGQSFVGTINIKGNLDGDILMPPDVLNSLLASNATPTVNATTSSDGSTINANLNNNTAINNNVNLSALTGGATVSDNTAGGDATTGSATTKLTLLNLTGQQVIGADALLVFVNVQGKWVGMIVNAPAGATAAALGGGITGNSTAGTNTTINGSINNSINNNLNLASQSGNASVVGNTQGGNATTGNASAAANIVNISNSDFALTNWLGILFINIFGDWNGSFGINTAAGNAASSGTDAASVTAAVKAVKVFSFVPSGSGNNFAVAPVASATSPNTTSDSNHKKVVLSASTSNDTSPPTHRRSMVWTAGSLFFLAGVLSAEEIFTNRKTSKEKFRQYLHSVTVQPLKKDTP